jgi:hypothetical protein
MSDLTRIQTAFPIQVTDADSQAAVLATTLPSSSAIALVVRDAAQGIQTSANSRPVVVASDQQIGRSNFVAGQTSVGLLQVQLPNNAVYMSVTVKANNGNSGTVYVGVTGVTTSTGFELGAGESVSLPVDNTNRIFVIADAASQTISYVGV